MKKPKNRHEAEELIGREVKLKNCGSNCMGTIENNRGLSDYDVRMENGSLSYVYYKNIILMPVTIEEFHKRKEMLERQKEKIDKKIENINTKIKFMEDNELEEFDPMQYKVLNALEVMNQEGVSDVEKSKIIAGLIKG